MSIYKFYKISRCKFFTLLFLNLFVVGSSLAATTITVDTSLDFAEVDDNTGNADNYTCTFTSGAFFYPAPNGKCSLRRAILEAGVRPNSDRPINIEFSIPTSDTNYDSSLGIWEVQIDSSFIWEIRRRNILDDGGQVTIDGGTRPDGGPAIMINNNSDNSAIFGRSLEVRTSNNTFRNLGFHGGGQIILYEGNNLVENIWMGLKNDGSGLKLASTVDDQAERSMARGGIIMPNSASDNNIIRNNRIIGANERAIRVTSGGSGNLIEDNFIGMDSKGEVPITGTINCTSGSDYNSSLWYGGRSIQVTGSNNTVRGNTMAGLHATHAANETPPISMEIFGDENLVTGNTVGIDASGKKVGVCGQGLLFGGDESTATQNTFYFTRNGFDPNDIDTDFDAAIITQSFSGGSIGAANRWLKVWDNVIDGGDAPESNFHAYRFASPGVNIEMRQFIPAKVTSINGLDVSGTNGDKLVPESVEPFCPECTVFLYLDDDDDRVESFKLIGTAIADSNGDWSTTISQALAANQGIRTQSMANNNSTFLSDSSPERYHAAQTTTRLSDDLYTVDSVILPPTFSLDIDDNGETAPLTDGLLVLRSLFGFTGSSLINGAIASDAIRTSAADIETYLQTGVNGLALDIDDNGEVTPLTDGLLVLRYLFGFKQQALINGAISSNANRTNADDVEAYILSLIP